jgi:sec-independent protein translocase protein TatA
MKLGGSEWLILALLVVVLFGAKRLPDVARGVGRSLRIFKAEVRGLQAENIDLTDAGTGPADDGRQAGASAQRSQSGLDPTSQATPDRPTSEG